MHVISLFEYEGASFRYQLKELYRELDQTFLGYEVPVENRRKFFRRMRGRFLRISQKKRETPIEQILNVLKISVMNFDQIESGDVDLSDRNFFMIAAYLGVASEISVFLEKLEKAMTPGLRDARARSEKALQIYGIRFADSSKE